MSTQLVLRQSLAPSRSVPAVRRGGLTPSLLLAPLLLAAGVAALAWDYALLPAAPVNHLLYWLGLGAAFTGAWLAGRSRHASTIRHLLALAGFAATTWLPYLLRSPDRLLFMDERYHLDVLERIAATGSTVLDARLYALPGSFPGLEDATLTVMAFTGLPAEVATRFVTLLIHVTIPLVAYLLGRGLGFGRRGAFLVALIYIANSSYLFFHSVFSYETLGILLYLSTWALVALHVRAATARDRSARSGDGPPGAALGARRARGLGGRRTLELTALPLVAAIAISHHISSYLLTGSLLIAWLLLRRQRSSAAGAVRNVALLAGAFAVAWFVINIGRLGPYLGGTFTDRFAGVIDTLLADRSEPRTLFAHSEVPLLERLIASLFPVIVLFFGVGGVFTVWGERWTSWVRNVRPGAARRRATSLTESRSSRPGRANGAASRSPLWAPLALVGPIGWLLTTPAVVTRSGELAYRSWPFLFIGVAGFGALTLLGVERFLRGRRPRLAEPVLFGLMGILLIGGFSIGNNQSGRFPVTQPVTAAGPANATEDVLAAAAWLRATAGEGHVVATDSGSAVTFSTDGGQRILRWNSWFPFVVDDPAEIVPFMRDTGTEYLVADTEITSLPPRYTGYFGPPRIPAAEDPGQPLPAALLRRLDTVPGLERIYDGGRIRIYRVAAGAVAAGAAVTGSGR